MASRDEIPAPLPTPCPLCQGERFVAESNNNVTLKGQGKVVVLNNYSTLWALVCQSCGYTLLFAKSPSKIRS